MPCQAASAQLLNPDLILISGGTAMTATARALTQYTDRTLHLLSPFDSGGSSASLREYLGIPGVGDLRSRLVALASSEPVFQQRASCMAQRLDDGKRPVEWLANCLQAAKQAATSDSSDTPVWMSLVEATERLSNHLPASFPWEGTSFGNLMIAAGITELPLSLSTVSEQLEAALACHGHARCVSNDDLQLAAKLSNGEIRTGQHQITGKQVAPIQAPIDELYLFDPQDAAHRPNCRIAPEVKDAITQCKLIVLCPGSFYTSLIAQLLPAGLTEQMQKSPARIAYIPNLGVDPEQLGQTPQSSLQHLEDRLQPAQLDWIVMDPDQQAAFSPQDSRILSLPLRNGDNKQHDANKLAFAIQGLLDHASAPSGRGRPPFIDA